MSAVVDSWSCPTTIYAGVGALRHLGQVVADTGPAGLVRGGSDCTASGSPSPVVLVTDERIASTSHVARIVAAATDPVTWAVRRAADDDEAFLAAVGAVLRDHPDAAVVALGGGSVLDVARVAVLADGDPAFATALRGTPPGVGKPDTSESGGSLLESTGPMRMWPAARDAACPLVCIPTTLGTAAEVSPIAILRRAGATHMIISPALRSRVAILDPLATAGRQRGDLLAGLLEPLSRVLVPAVAGASLPLQDGLAAALTRVLLDLGETAGPVPDEAWRLSAALASCQTHTAFLSLGRSPFGHALWPFATEFMAALGITKASALARLMPAWLRGLASGDLGPAFGSASRVIDILGRPADEAAGRLAQWLEDVGLAAGTRDPGGSAQCHDQSAEAVTSAIVTGVRDTWQATGFFLADATGSEIEWLAAAAPGS